VKDPFLDTQEPEQEPVEAWDDPELRVAATGCAATDTTR